MRPSRSTLTRSKRSASRRGKNARRKPRVFFRPAIGRGGHSALPWLFAGRALAAAAIPGRQTAVLGQELAGARALGALGPAAGLWLPTRGLGAGNELVLAVADQVGAAEVLQGLPQERPVVRVVVAQKSLVEAPGVEALGRHHPVAAPAGDAVQGVVATVVHGGGHGHGRWVEGLHLVGAKAVALEPQRQVHHVLIRGARVGGDEVGDQVLLL